jgi:hypothetical protein
MSERKQVNEENIEELVAKEAADIEEGWERGEKPSAPLHRNRPRGEPSVIYNVRMPAGRLEQLRQLADQAGVPPSTLMRGWVLERLDRELAREVEPDPRVRMAIRLELERAGLIDKAS